MSRDLFEKRKLEFMQTILKIERLPKLQEYRFKDGEDQRLWFNGIIKIEKFKYYIDEIKLLLSQFGIKLLSDKEKETEFLELIQELDRIPAKDESYFTDNDEMHSWYMSYKDNHKEFETKVHNSLTEYKSFNLEEKMSSIKKEFISTIKILKRIPKHGEAKLQDGTDVRVIYDKLESYDPELVEKLLLHLQAYKKESLSKEERASQLIAKVSELGYIPYLQESRFSDGTDMFTWYTAYKEKMPDLEIEVQSLITKDNPNKKVNIYIIPNFKKSGGKFYTICTNTGERLDLSNIASYEEALQLDGNLKKRGGLILKKDEEIGSITFGKGRSK